MLEPDPSSQDAAAEELLRRALLDESSSVAVSLKVRDLPLTEAVTIIFHGRRDLGTLQTYVTPGSRGTGTTVAASELLRVPCDPDLAEAARKAGMKTFGQMEIFPSTSSGFRLPLCRGRTLLLDRPLTLTYNRRVKRKVQDVEGYVGWLLDPERRYMPAAEVVDYLAARLVRPEPAQLAQGPAPKTKGKAQSKKRQRTKTGHRQDMTRLRVDDIVIPS